MIFTRELPRNRDSFIALRGGVIMETWPRRKLRVSWNTSKMRAVDPRSILGGTAREAENRGPFRVIEWNPDHRCLQRSNTWDRQKWRQCFPPPRTADIGCWWIQRKEFKRLRIRAADWPLGPGSMVVGDAGSGRASQYRFDSQRGRVVSVTSFRHPPPPPYLPIAIVRNARPVMFWKVWRTVENSRGSSDRNRETFLVVVLAQVRDVKWYAAGCTYTCNTKNRSGGRCA